MRHAGSDLTEVYSTAQDIDPTTIILKEMEEHATIQELANVEPADDENDFVHGVCMSVASLLHPVLQLLLQCGHSRKVHHTRMQHCCLSL